MVILCFFIFNPLISCYSHNCVAYGVIIHVCRGRQNTDNRRSNL